MSARGIALTSGCSKWVMAQILQRANVPVAVYLVDHTGTRRVLSVA